MKLLALLSFEQKSTEKVELGSRKRLLYYLAKSNLKKNLAKEISIVQDIDSNTLSILTFRLKRFFSRKLAQLHLPCNILSFRFVSCRHANP